ncbi:MAG: efflux transporter outer membrane subunit [Ectothiorhodospiraceae bacterium]|nr:efflux transporter outer membrane subunit [Ectothiorhodospiraceae bacterium]MCH8506794.1 efflux transporter outer membrane subunit [Ectothiorhodospiraceae bacterium]
MRQGEDKPTWHFSSGSPQGRGEGVLLRRLFPLLAATALLALSACSGVGGPEYQRPDVPEKGSWSDYSHDGLSATEAIHPEWWEGFGDPYLNELVELAIDQGTDLRILAARVEEARAVAGLRRAATLPTLTATTDAAVIRSRPEVLPGTFADPLTTRQYGAQAALNWEIDVWGKLRRGVRAQEAAYQASEADWRAGYLTLVSEVANTYFLIRQLDEQHLRQQTALDKNRQILTIYEAQLTSGIAPRTRVLQQRAEVSSLQQQILDLRRQRDIAQNQLATLLGIPAGELEVPVVALRDTVDALEVPVGLPSDLLSRRPDIIAAEFRVLEAHELVGEARLARLPSFSLTAIGGLASGVLSTLLQGYSFGLAPSIDIPIFDPATRVQRDVRGAQATVAEEQYRRTVLTAFEEVENALVSVAYRKQQREEALLQLEDLREVNAQVHAQLLMGLVSQLEVFESERTLLAAELQLLALHQQLLSDTVTLYKALGGGWPLQVVYHSG